LLALLIARRHQTAELVGGAAIAGLGRFVVESRPDASPEALLARRTALATVTAAVLDLVYLLLGYALLRMPLIEQLEVALGPLVAAVVVTAAAGLIWAVLVVRLQVLAGGVGLRGLGHWRRAVAAPARLTQPSTGLRPAEPGRAARSRHDRHVRRFG
jgi:hypothetical protein